MYSPFTKITYILTFPPTSLEQFLRAIWNAVSRATVLILPQIKLNLQLSRRALFLSRYLSHLLCPSFRRKVAPGHPWSRTPHSLGPGGTPMALPTRQRRHRAPKRERGDLDVDPFVSPHPSVVQPPPGTHTLSWVPNTWRRELLFSPVSVCLPYKVVTVAAVTLGFHSNRDAQPCPPHWNASYVVAIIYSLEKLHPLSHTTPRVLSSAWGALHWDIKIREYPAHVWHILIHPSIHPVNRH